MRKLTIIPLFLVCLLAFPMFASAGTELNSTNNNNNYLTIPGSGSGTAKINNHVHPLGTPITVTSDYNGPVFRDHKYQEEILQYILSENVLKPFVIKKRGLFTKKTTHSTSDTVSIYKYPKQKTVYVFRDIEELKARIKKYNVVGYTDAYSKGKATLMDCFNQSVIDAGTMGGNILVLLRVDFVASVGSSTIGLGGSGTAGFLNNLDQSSVFGSVFGYAKSKATPETNPYIYGIVLFSKEFDKNLFF